VRGLRAALLGILLFGAAGTLVELLLLKHTEKLLQWTPLVLLVTVLVAVVLRFALPGAATMHLCRVIFSACVASGFVGIWQHYRGNVEFELELRATLSGWELVRRALVGAFPVLAPGTMIWLGLVGLAYTYRHPLLRRR